MNAWDTLNGCPKCGGLLFPSKDKHDGLYKWCLNCGWRVYKIIVESKPLPLVIDSDIHRGDRKKYSFTSEYVRERLAEGMGPVKLAKELGCHYSTIYMYKMKGEKHGQSSKAKNHK